MEFCVLSTGSRGNAYAFWNNHDGILIDVGLSYKRLRGLFEQVDLDPWAFRHLLISHYHGDHIRSVRSWAEHHGGVVYAHSETVEAVPYLADRPHLVEPFEYRKPFACGSFTVTPWPVIHDTPGAVTFTVRCTISGQTVALILETGRITREIADDSKDADALIIEANHEPQLVAKSVTDGEIPVSIGQRILATHLRNETTGRFVAELAGFGRLKLVVLAHLSAERNTPELAREAVEQALGAEMCGGQVRIIVSEQDQPTEVIDLNSLRQGRARHGEGPMAKERSE